MLALFTEALHGASSNAGWHCQRLPFCSFVQSLPELIKCLDGWHWQILLVSTGHGDLVDDRTTAGPARADQPTMAWMFPGGYR